MWTPKTINFPFVPNGKLMVFRCPIFKHIRVVVIVEVCLPMILLLCFFLAPS